MISLRQSAYIRDAKPSYPDTEGASSPSSNYFNDRHFKKWNFLPENQG